jgi:hypothetical protein
MLGDESDHLTAFSECQRIRKHPHPIGLLPHHRVERGIQFVAHTVGPSVMKAMTRISAPQSGHTSGNTS